MGAKNSKFLRDLVQLSADFLKFLKQHYTAHKAAIENKTTNASRTGENLKQAAESHTASCSNLVGTGSEKTIDVIDCLTELDIYRLDFSALHAFFDKTDLVRKVNGFIMAAQR